MRDMVEQHDGEILDEVYLPVEAGEAQLEEVIRDIVLLQPNVVFSTLVGESARQNPGMIEQLAAGIASQGYMSRHSRDAERESDTDGLNYMIKAGYDPDAMPAFFKKLQKMSGGNPGAFQQFFASHPAPGERATTLAKDIRAKGNPAGKSEIVGNFAQIKSQIGSTSGSKTTTPKSSGSTTQQPSGGTQQAPRPK